jgi:hypothetical protein
MASGLREDYGQVKEKLILVEERMRRMEATRGKG